MFCEKIKPMIPGLLKAHCSVKASPAGIYDMTLGRYLTDDDVITPCTSHNPGIEAVPAHHPSLKGKTIAQIKSMLLKLEDPVSVPSKILIKPLRILATEKLNAADRRCVQLDSRHHLDLDSHSDLTELSTSESEDNNASEFKENNMFKSSQGKSEDDNTHQQVPQKHGLEVVPPSKNTVQPTRPHAVKTPRQTPTNPRATAGTDHDTVSPTSTSTSPPKRPRSIKTPCQTPENHQTAAGTDHKTVSPASISIGPPLGARADKTTCQILAAALLPGVVFSDGHANTPPLENCPSQERNSPVEEAPLFDLPSQQCVSEPLIPSNPQDPKNQTLMVPTAPPLSHNITPPLIEILSSPSAEPAPTAYLDIFKSEDMQLLSAIDFSKPLPDKSSSSPNIPMIFLDKPLEAYHPPIPLAVLPFTTVVSQQTKEEQPLLAEIPDNQPTTSNDFAPMDIDTIEEPKRCPSEEIFQCLDENIVQAKDGTWHLLAIDRYLKPPVRCQVPTNRSKVPPTSSKHLPSGPNNLEEFCSCTQTRNRYQVPSLVQAKLRLMSPSPIPSEQLVPMNQPGDRESGKVKTEVTQAPPAADSDPSALPNKDVFQCLDKDIKEAKLKLQSAKPIPAKRASIPVEQPSKPLSPTRIFPNIPPGAKKTEAAQAPKTANSNLPSSGRSLQHPKVKDDDCCHFTSLTFDFRVNTYTQAKCAPFPVEQPSKPISPWILPTEGSCGTKTEATQALYTAHSSALALPSIRPSPDPVKIKENACTHPTSPPSPPQLVIVLDTPTAVDSSALASPSIRTSPDPVKVEEDVCTHPTYLPSLPQLAVVLDTPTAADAQASALPSSQPSPDHVKVEEDRHTHPISPPSPPQLAVVLDTLTAADSIVPALPRSTPSPQLIVASAAWEDNTSTTVSEDTVRGGPADVPSAAYADANETYHPLESSSSADTVTRRPADDVPSAVYPHVNEMCHPLTSSPSPRSVQTPASIPPSLINSLEEEEEL
ncbi:hypothetical protein KEM48_009379 [Puccinia striiformis f. sp. tritici PST-130]|nr:hypothetical protein KEM48_009379 [Puccinia striiformis f. sp. tritici PST-130]